VIEVAPCYVVSILYPADTGIIGFEILGDIGIVAYKPDWIRIDLEVDPVSTSACMNPCFPAGIVAAKYTCKGTLERHHGTVEDTVGCGEQVTRDNRIPAVSPHHCVAAGRPLFPGNI
jgi:hypothetical protein